MRKEIGRVFVKVREDMMTKVEVRMLQLLDLKIAGVQPRLIQGIQRGDGVRDYLNIHQRYKE